MTASGNEPRKHHVVPNFYLSRWAEEGRIKVTDLDARTSHSLDPKNALRVTDFYRVPAGTAVGSDSPVVWESWLSQIEGDAKEVFDRLDEVGFLELTPDELGRLAFFIAVQTTRSRWHRYQGRWTMSVGAYRAFGLDRPGAIERAMREAGLDPTADEVEQATAYWEKIVADPWQVPISAGLEMDIAQRTANDLADVLATRKWIVYETAKPLLTCDEPVVTLHEFMGGDHLNDGGYMNSPIVIFPLGPHQVLAMFREDMPLLRSPDVPLDYRETLDLNQVIAGNSFRNAVSQPSNPIAGMLRIPDGKPPTEFILGGDASTGGFYRMRVLKRWSDELDAPVRPVPAWWPLQVPFRPGGPRTAEEHYREFQRWSELGGGR